MLYIVVLVYIFIYNLLILEGLKDDYFTSRHRFLFRGAEKNDGTTLRSLYYPPLMLEDSELKEGMDSRISTHTDYVSMTLLFQDDSGGLEVNEILFTNNT